MRSAVGPLGLVLVSSGLLAGCGGATAAAPPPEAQEEDAPPVVVALRLGEAPPAEGSEAPRTRLSLVRIVHDEGRTTQEVGVVEGACTPAVPEGDVVLAATCWWAGVDLRIVVHREDDALVAYRVDATDPESPRELGRLELPEDAEIEPLR